MSKKDKRDKRDKHSKRDRKDKKRKRDLDSSDEDRGSKRMQKEVCEKGPYFSALGVLSPLSHLV